MRKIDLLVLLPVILTKGVYASGSGNYFGGWLFGDNNNRIPIMISPAAFFGTDVLQRNLVDFVRYPNINTALLRMRYASLGGRNFSQNSIMNECFGELSYSPELNRNIFTLRTDIQNHISSNDARYRRPVSVHIDRNNPENVMVEILLRSDIETTGRDATDDISVVEESLIEYRPDILERLRSLGFLRRR